MHTPITATIPTYPVAPSSSNPDDFAVEGDAFLSAMQTNQPDYNTMADQMNVVGSETNDNATAADASATAAANSASTASSSANNAGAWNLQTGAKNPPYAVTHTGSTWILDLPIVDITLSEPTGVNSDWTEVSGVTQAELDLKAPLENPALTGNPTAPTQTVGDDSTKIATTAFVLANTPDNTLSVTVQSWSFVTTTITINSTNHGLAVGNNFFIKGLVSTTFSPNGMYVVASVIDVNSFTYSVSTAPTGSPTVISPLLYKSLTASNIQTINNRYIQDIGTVFNNQRLIFDNLFGNENYEDCDVRVEIFANSRWSETGFSSYTGSYRGTHAYSNAEGIVVQSQEHLVMQNSSAGGGGHGSASSLSSALARIIVQYNGKRRVI